MGDLRWPIGDNMYNWGNCLLFLYYVWLYLSHVDAAVILMFSAKPPATWDSLGFLDQIMQWKYYSHFKYRAQIRYCSLNVILWTI